MTPSELKKWKRKKRREQLRREKEKEEERLHREKLKQQQQQQNKGKKSLRINSHIEEDPDGEELIRSELDYLTECTKYLKTLQTFSPNLLSTHILAFDVYKHKRKPLLQLRALKKAIRIDRRDPRTHYRTIQFLNYATSNPNANAFVQEVMDLESADLFDSRNAEEVNQCYLDENRSSAPHRLAAARGIMVVSPEKKDNAVSLATDLSGENVNIEHCDEVLRFLRSLGCESEVLQSFKADCRERFPLATIFASEPQA